MQKRKFYTVIILLVLAAGVALTTTRCYDDDKDTRVTIHLERNDLAYMGIPPEKHLIDRILEFFSTRAEASFPDPWTETNRTSDCSVTLYVSAGGSAGTEYSIPYDATEYTVIVPSSNATTFTVISSYLTNKNWGGHSTVNLGPGDQDITVKMIPITKIKQHQSFAVNSMELGINYFSTPPSNTSAVNIYKSNSADGEYTKIGTTTSITSEIYFTDSNVVSDNYYYYKVSVSGSDGEGVLSDYYEAYHSYP